ncbi:uncharacterized protein LOC110466316 [Mizuhopecten yessoensis]|uniref:Complement C1q subcomponent subunit C n=1 Tax=Mizuhopecten yessoensis TaxID=6573 RepID=A0A210PPK8_MIZYE|nr:uncharacterized protein LOC110466316 [Mizuhopecten yessoensis]OWF38435.1 Complement C1q subcomponent subunit C [Mizuhopecten yessoensis]
MDVFLIAMLWAGLGITLGDVDRLLPSFPSSPEDVGIHVLDLIYDLENRVRLLEDSRSKDVRRMRDMQSEIDELKSDNYRLQQQSSYRTTDVTTNIHKTPSDNHFSDEFVSESRQKPVYKFVQNNTASIMLMKNEDGPRSTKPDVLSKRTKTIQSLFRRRRGNAPSIPKRTGSTRVGSTNVIAFHAILGTTVTAPAVNHEIVYDHVITNNGNMYSSLTGTFTCQQPGTYVFSWSTLTNANNFLDSHLVKNGVRMGSIVNPRGTHSGSTSGLVVIQLDEGDLVWVRVGNHDSSANVYASWSMFSGFKLN